MEFSVEKDLLYRATNSYDFGISQKTELFQIYTYTTRTLFNMIQRIVLVTQKLPFSSYR